MGGPEDQKIASKNPKHFGTASIFFGNGSKSDAECQIHSLQLFSHDT